MPYTVKFKSKDGDAFDLEIEDAESTIEELKIRLISMDESYDGCNLIFAGKICKDSATLASCGMVEGASGACVVMKKKKAAPEPPAAVPDPTPVVPAASATAAGTSAASSSTGAGGAAAAAQAPSAAPVEVDPAVVDTIIAMGISTDRKFIEDMIRKCNGNADQAMAWILEPEQMMQEEREARHQAQRRRADRAKDKLNVLPYTERNWAGLIPDGILLNGGTSVIDAQTFFEGPQTARESVMFLLGTGSASRTRQLVQTLSMVYVAAEAQLSVVYIPTGEQDEGKFGDLLRTMPWASMKFKSAAAAAVMKRFEMQFSDGSVLLHRPSGQVWSFSAVSDLAIHNFDYSTARVHWSARGHIGKPAPFTKENPTGAGTGSQGSGSMTGGATASSSSSVAGGGGMPAVAPFPNPNSLPGMASSGSGAAARMPQQSAPSNPPPPTTETTAVLPGGSADVTKGQVEEAVSDLCEKGTFEAQEEFFATALKVFNNIYDKPAEVKFQSIKSTNAKLFGPYQFRGDEMTDETGVRPGLSVFGLAGFAQDGEMQKWNAKGEPVESVRARLIAVRNHVFAIGKTQHEAKYRFERDQKIKEEMEKDKGRQAKYGEGTGAGGGRMNLGQDRKKRGGG
ncbi:unnamed protein product [Amoebophrya sp. A25]|nr:unnamed protein product [Amoebophrya sp. A25]|eukprot:GSA25T00010176001.1